MSSDASRKLEYLRVGLLWLGTAFALLAGYLSFYVYPNTLAYGGGFSLIAIMTYMDSFLIREIGPLMGSNLRWQPHFVPSAFLMNAGGILTLFLLVSSQPTVPVLSSMLLYGLGFIWTLNQIYERPDAWLELHDEPNRTSTEVGTGMSSGGFKDIGVTYSVFLGVPGVMGVVLWQSLIYLGLGELFSSVVSWVGALLVWELLRRKWVRPRLSRICR